MATFIAIGENIHCSRILKIDGESVVSREDGSLEIQFSEGGTRRALPLPQNAPQIEEWTKGRKVKHLAVTIWQGMHGGAAAQETAVAYLRYIAAAQTAKGAAYLDVNVDEFSTDREEKIRAMRWVAATVQQASPLPLSIDSSDVELLNAGLEACDLARGKPLLNSVSLERMAALDIARSAGASVIAGATGDSSDPTLIAWRFSPVSNGKRANIAPLDELRVLVATDVDPTFCEVLASRQRVGAVVVEDRLAELFHHRRRGLDQ